MSSTGRASERIELDQYWTQRWCVHRLLEAYILPPGLWLEPCAGTGAIIRAVSEVRSDVTWHANEIDPSYLPGLQALPAVATLSDRDARELTLGARPVVSISNPPFTPSLEILAQMLPLAETVIFLQRLNWAAGPRRELFRSIKPSVYVLPDRPSFVDMYDEETPSVLKAQTDSIEYAWFVFDGRGAFGILADTPAEVRRAEIEEGRANGTRPKKMSKPKRQQEAA